MAYLDFFGAGTKIYYLPESIEKSQWGRRTSTPYPSPPKPPCLNLSIKENK